MTDALCFAAISTGLGTLRDLVENDTPEAWDKMAWVSTCGGLALANSGLGAVHGFAGVIGGETNAPHGAICGALLPAVLESHQRKAVQNTEISVRLHWVIHQIDTHFAQGGIGAGITALRSWSKDMGLAGLEGLGLSLANHSKVAAAAAKASSMSGNPFSLSHDELLEILHSAK
jgi:alcohol dehydrogenase class IV